MDVKTAFLQGKPLDRYVFIKARKEAKTTNLWKLKKCVYGLNEVSRYWYNRVTIVVCSSQNITKPIFTGEMKENMRVFLPSMLIYYNGGSLKFEKLVQKIKTILTVGTEDLTLMKYLGMNISEVDGEIYFSQDSYVDSCEETEIENKIDKSWVFNAEEQASFRNIYGQLNWISTQSAPNIAFDACQFEYKVDHSYGTFTS